MEEGQTAAAYGIQVGMGPAAWIPKQNVIPTAFPLTSKSRFCDVVWTAESVLCGRTNGGLE